MKKGNDRCYKERKCALTWIKDYNKLLEFVHEKETFLEVKLIFVLLAVNLKMTIRLDSTYRSLILIEKIFLKYLIIIQFLSLSLALMLPHSIEKNIPLSKKSQENFIT